MSCTRTALLLALLLLCGALAARGGDGGDYSGGSSDGSSGGSSDYGSSSSSDWGSSSTDYGYGESGGGGGGGNSPAGVVIALFVVVAILIGAAISSSRTRRKFLATGRVINQPRRDPMHSVRAADPNFSAILFRAFAHLVYVKYHESRGGIAPSSSEEFAVAPYLHPNLRRQLTSEHGQIDRVIVGGIRVLTASASGLESRVELEFKSNLVVRLAAGTTRRLLMIQQFTFRRPGGVLTRAPELVLALGCPSCGSRQEPDAAGRCGQCGRTVGGGEMDWQVVRVHSKPPVAVHEPLGQGGVEVGTDYATRVVPGLAAGERHLRTRDPGFSWDEFQLRAHTVFMKLQEGWTMRDESILRPYELDHVFDAHRIWLERYREQGVRNVLEDVVIEKTDRVKIEGDAWYDCITVRIFAGMIDYNVKDDGTVLSGSKTARKRFSEYFTFVRRAGHAPGKPKDPLTCPQCGAPLDRVSQLGVCGYCDTRITTGNFDWVLAEITQDEDYAG